MDFKSQFSTAGVALEAECRNVGVRAKFSVIVARLDWMEEQKVWMLADKDGKRLGEFWAVVATDKNLASPSFSIQNGIPPPLTEAGVPSIAEKVAGVTSSSSFACMLAFPQHLTSFPFDGFTITGSKVLSWAARDNSKPQRDKLSAGECWVLHSTAEYAQEVIEKDGTGKSSEALLMTVTRTLLEHFESIGEVPTPEFAKSHGWGSAFPNVSIANEEKCLVDEVRRVAICGDFCVGPRVECAIQSGISAAEKILELAHTKAKLSGSGMAHTPTAGGASYRTNL